MTPVDQEFLHDPEIGQSGDCQRAVIASLLDLPISEVPHFLQEANAGGAGFYCRIGDFLEVRGLEMLWHASPIYHLKEGVDVYHDIMGPSPRGNGLFHAVVGCNGKIVHDPHPDKTGLAGDPSKWRHSFLVKS